MTRIIKNPGRGYSGREKQPIYAYNLKGKFLQKYESLSDCKTKLLKKDKNYPIFRREKRCLGLETKRAAHNYAKIDNYFICKERLGREKLLKLEKTVNSQFLDKKLIFDKPIVMCNLNGDILAEFKNKKLASKILNLKIHIGSKTPKKDFYFKYKK